jgi:hypothetical protein
MAKMARACRYWGVLLAVALAASPSARLAHGADGTGWHGTRISGADYEIPLNMAERNPGPDEPLLTAIATWLSTEFDLPILSSHPRIELVPPARIAALRYQRLLPDAERAAGGHSAISSERDVVAVYSDAARTIYLADDWTGSTPAELSVLVHEMVHHLQNLAGLKYECPQAREQLAYLAQERWLGLFGHNLAQDFELDGFSLLTKTKCFH